MTWYCIMFEDGSNPYICKTENEFQRMKRKYELEHISGKFWSARKKCLSD